MRSAAEIKKRVTGDIRKLNFRLLVVSTKIAIRLQKHELARTPPGRIVVALFKKAVNTFRAIQLLKSDRLLEECFVLLRVLLEAHINLIYFLESRDAKTLTQRWSDAAVLDKLKYLHEIKFYEGTPLAGTIDQNRWAEVEATISTRYTEAELHVLKRNGFSGMSVQARAEAIRLGGLYSHCYRITSRAVHTFDPAETGLMDYVSDPREVDELRRSRRQMLDSTQNMLLGRLAFLMSEIVADPMTSLRMLTLGIGYEKYRDQQDGAATNESEDGTFYIWRESDDY